MRVFSNGDFYVLNFVQKEMCHLFHLDCGRFVKTAKAFIRQLEDLESVNVLFSNENVQEVNFRLYIEAGELLIEKLAVYHNRNARRALLDLRRATIALKYRLESFNGGYDPEAPNEEMYHQLLHAAQVWKHTQAIFPEKRLTKEDENQLKEASRYTFFIKLLLDDEELADSFFLWALRDHIAVRPFIEFPHNQWKMNRYALNGRLSRRGGRDLRVQKIQGETGLEKVLTLPFEGKPVNILDESRSIMFKGNYGLTIKEVYEIFDHKRIEAGNLEYMEEGIINWNAHHWGYWDADLQDYQRIDFEKNNWWNDLPVLERLSLQQARNTFGHHLTGVEWNLALTSSRVHQDLNFVDAHGYLSISIPQGDGSYLVYTLGKFTFTFPETLVQALLNIGETAEATVAYPDENVYYTHRRKTRYSYAINEKEGRRFFESVKRDMLLSREGNLIYQIESDNCAKWAYDKLVEAVGQFRVPEIYTMPFLDSEPDGVLKTVFKMIKSLPEGWQIPVTTCIHFFLGGYKGRLIIENSQAIWKSLTHHSFWEDTVIFHPSMLYKQQEVGNIGRFVPSGITLAVRTILRFVSQGETFYKKFISYLKSVTYKFSLWEVLSQSSLTLNEYSRSKDLQIAGNQQYR